MPAAPPPADEIRRRLHRRQDLADAATAALAHGQPIASTLYTRLSEFEDALERDHPRAVAQLFGRWATRDADHLGHHLRDEMPDCPHCHANREQRHQPPANRHSA